MVGGNKLGPDTSPWELPALSKEEAIRLLSGPFGNELHHLAIDCMTYFVFGQPSREGSEANLQNGTCFFIDTGRKILAVTAAHVIKGYQRAKELNAATRCQLGTLLIDPLARLAGMGEATDIATIELTADELARVAKRPISLWPPTPPESDNQSVLLAGFPGAGVRIDGPNKRGYGIYVASGIAQRVTDRQISCSIEWEESFTSPGHGTLPPRQYETGGMSGGPMLLIREQAGILSFPLAGVIFEGRAETDTLVAERADAIRADGTIRG